MRTLFTGEFATALTSARTILLVVSLPLWAVFAVSFGSPLLAFLGVLLAQVIGRKGAKELEIRSKREETLRTMRWAADLSASKEDRLADLGVAELEALLGSDLLEESEKTFVEAALTAVYEDPEEQLDGLGAEGETVEVFVADARAILQLASDSDVTLGGDSDDGEERDGEESNRVQRSEVSGQGHGVSERRHGSLRVAVRAKDRQRQDATDDQQAVLGRVSFCWPPLP